MTNQEFSTFAKRLFTAFPDVWEWMNANSPNPTGTQEVWREVLKDCTLAECLLVLDSWLTGKRPLFKAYERGQLAVMIRQSVYFERDKGNRFNQSEEERAEYSKTKRGDYRPIGSDQPGLAQKLREGRALQKRLADGEITEHEFVIQKRQLIDSVQ